VRAAVERKFEVVGEALGQLARLDPELAARIPDYRRIIAFRNILIHGVPPSTTPRSGGSPPRRYPACTPPLSRL
jgi:uncharacterized protein with HEPN domain